MNNLDKLFDLGNFEESTNVDDIMDTEISEGAENDLATGKKVSPDQTNISVPGGISDSTKPADGEYGPKPGEADKNHQPADKADVSIPASTTLTADQYNAALAALKKSFKEGVQIMEILESATIVHKTLEEEQAEYTESIMADAYVQALEDGPLFERVTDDDRMDVKSITQQLRSKVKRWCADQNIRFVKIGSFLSSLAAILNIKTFYLGNRVYTCIGIITVNKKDIESTCEAMTNEFSNILGKYKISPLKLEKTDIVRSFGSDFGPFRFKPTNHVSKNANLTEVLLIVDKDSENVKKVESELNKVAKEADKKDDKKSDKKEKAVKESVEEGSNDELLTEKKKCKKCEEDDECCKKDKKACKDEDKKDEK